MERSSSTSAPRGEDHAAELLELGDAFLELDRDWRIVRVSRRQEELSRKPRRETLGRSFWDVWPDLATPSSAYWREYHRCMEERVPVEFEEHYPPLDLWTGVTAYPVSGGGIAVFFRDVSERKRAEEALRTSEERLRSVLENMSEGVMLFDAAGNLAYQNPASLRIHGFERGADGRIARDHLPQTWNAWDERGRAIRFDEWPVSRVFRGERFQDQVLRVERAETGHVFHGSYNGAPLRTGPDGKVEAGFITIREITAQVLAEAERARAAEAVRASEAKFRSVFEQAAIGMGRVSFDDARWIDVNDAFCRMLGRSREEMLRTPWPEITHPEDVDLDLVPFREMAAGELESYSVEKRFIHAEGHAVWARLTLSLVRDAGGRPDYEIAIIEDVGERRRAEASLRDANARLHEEDRRKNDFLGMLSHELRNPLAPVRNALYILERARPDGQQARRAKDILARQVEHLTRLVDDLLDVTRIARGKVQLRHEDLDLAALARRTVEDHRPVMQDRGLELVAELPPEAIVVNGDPARLTQVFGNLLSNAAKFTPAGGEVTLSLAAEGGRAVVHVRDTGPGIAPELLPALFDPFTQGEQTLARSEGGLGLGLSLVKGLVALHGGDVTVGAGPGGGADFAVTLPLAARDARRPPAPGPARNGPAAARRRVLVVEDNRDAADSLAEVIELLGHEAVVAHDAAAGLARASADRPDVVLCDIGLPGMDGYEFARRLRALGGARDLRLVALSGYAQPEDVARAVEAGFDAHVAKPLTPAALAGILAGPGAEDAGAAAP